MPVKYKVKLLADADADGANEIVRNAVIGAPLKYLVNFWGSLEMPLIKC